ncbi:unnamed protein product [Discula destructiva]
MQFLTFALALATAVSANNYTLFCGDSCNTGSPVSIGQDFSGAACTNVDTPQAYCYLVADQPYYKAIVSKESECIGSDAEQVIWPGDCYEGPWESYQVAVDL